MYYWIVCMLRSTSIDQQLVTVIIIKNYIYLQWVDDRKEPGKQSGVVINCKDAQYPRHTQQRQQH